MNRPIRAMAAGIPNVGKSTFINSFSGSSSLKTGNKPGVTKGKQWIRISKEVELMDTPGLLWPKFEDQSVGLKIALIGSMPDTILNTEELSLELIHVLAERYEGALASRYGIDESGLAENERLGGICQVRFSEKNHTGAPAGQPVQFRIPAGCRYPRIHDLDDQIDQFQLLLNLTERLCHMPWKPLINHLHSSQELIITIVTKKLRELIPRSLFLKMAVR